MKVLYVSHFGGLGGAERSLLELASAVRPLGVESIIACPRGGDLALRTTQLGIPHLAVPSIRRRRPRSLAAGVGAAIQVAHACGRLVRHVCSSGAALVHANSTLSELYCGPASRICRVPNVWHWRDNYDARRVARFLDMFADRIVAISAASYRFAHDQLGSDRKLVTFPNGIADLPASDPGGEPAAWRRRAGAGAGDVLVVMAGQSVPRKGHEVLIRAMAQPAVRTSRLRALLFCDELDEAAHRHTQAIRGIVDAVGVADRVAIATGCDDLVPVLRAADLLAVPSLVEPFGRVAVEGMLAELPVVASNVDGLGEIVEEGRTGFLVPPSNPALLAARLLSLGEQPALRRQMGQRGRERALRCFSSAALAARVVGLYRELLPRRGELVATLEPPQR